MSGLFLIRRKLVDHFFRVKLYVNDIEKSLLFYEEVIGLKLYKRNMHAVRLNHDQFSLLLASDSTLNENHYFYDRKERGMALNWLLLSTALKMYMNVVKRSDAQYKKKFKLIRGRWEDLKLWIQTDISLGSHLREESVQVGETDLNRLFFQRLKEQQKWSKKFVRKGSNYFLMWVPAHKENTFQN